MKVLDFNLLSMIVFLRKNAMNDAVMDNHFCGRSAKGYMFEIFWHC